MLILPIVMATVEQKKSRNKFHTLVEKL
jgi:hypothetical protein